MALSQSVSQYLARIIRAIVVSALGFGGGIGLLVFIAIIVVTGRQDALEIGMRAGLVIGVGFGCVLAVVLLLTDLTSRLFMAQGNYGEIWDLEQARSLDVPGTLKDVRRYCREALLAVPNVKVVSSDEEMIIKASTGASWKSPGELMEVTLEQKSEELWHLNCVSKTVASHIAFDYAKNFENVEMWRRQMKRYMDEDKIRSGHTTS